MNAAQTMEGVNTFVSTMMALMSANADMATDCPVMGEVALVKSWLKLCFVHKNY